MKKMLLPLLALFLALAPVAALAEHTRVTNPSSVGVEVLGRGLLYSVFVDRVMNDDLSAGLGLGSVGSAGGTAWMLPAYANYYFKPDQGSFFGSVGVTVVLNSASVEGGKTSLGNLTFAAAPVIPTIGLGYENRGDSGFLFRITAYGMIGNNIVPWGGMSFGYAL